MKKILAIILILSILLGIPGCASVQAPSAPSPAENTVVDGAGATLAIPDDPEEATIASAYAVSVPFLVALDLTDRVLAVNVKSKFWTDADEHLATAGTVGRGTVDLEALARYAPDVLIHRSNDPVTVESVRDRLGIDVLCVTVENYDDIRYTLTMLGEYFGRRERALEVCGWLDGKFAMIDEIVRDIPEGGRVTALMMGGELGRIAGGDMLQSWMIEKAGGICVAADITADRGWTNVGVETVFEWDPQFLFCTSSTALDYNVGKLLSDPAWSGLRAVRDGNVHVIPARLDSWDMPGISCALGTMYMLHRMYPERFGQEELNREIEEYYTFMFGKTFDAAYLGYDPES